MLESIGTRIRVLVACTDRSRYYGIVKTRYIESNIR